MPGLFRRPPRPQQRRRLVPPTPSVQSAYRDAVVARSPVGYWRLGESSGTTAVAVVGPNGTYEGSPTQNVTGLIDDTDKAVTFDGSNDSVNIGDQTWTDGTAKWTITAWVNSTADATYRRLFSKEDDSNFGVHLYWQNSEYGVVRRNTTDVIEAKVASGAPTGTHFVAASYSAVDDKLHLYLDGVQVAESTATTSGNFNHTHPFRISGAESTLVNVINGTIDEVAVFDYALDATAIEGLYNVGANGDQSPQYSDAVEDLSPTAYWRLDDTDSTMLATVGPNGTYVNTPTLGAAGALGGDLDTAVTFVSASSEYATVTDTAALDLGNTFSIVAWVKRTTAVDVTTILSKGADAYLLQFEFGNHLVLTQAGVAHSVSSAAVITDTRWHFVVATHTGTAGKLYIDGVEDSVPESATTFTDNTDALEIARSNGGGGYLNATLDEIALFNYVLTPTQITNLYRLGVGAEALDLGTEVDAELASGTGAANLVRAIVSPNALIAAGVGAANNASVKISVGALIATGTGAAGDVDELMSVRGTGVATGTGSGLNVIPLIKPNAGLSSGTGSAHSPPVKIEPRAAAATGTGAANTVSASINVNAGVAAGTGAANDATVRSDTFAAAQVATGTGAALDASVAITVTNLQSIVPGGGEPGGDAPWPSVHVQPNASAATGTGSAHDATVLAFPYVYAAAQVATGTGLANNASVSIRKESQLAAGTGDARAPLVHIKAHGVVLFPTSGAAGAVFANIKPNASIATGTGAANNATVLVAPYRYAAAELASGTGAANNITPSVKPNAGLSAGTGASQAPSGSVVPRADLAAGTGSAEAAHGNVAPNAQTTSGTGQAYDATVTVAANTYAAAELASGTGSALGPMPSVLAGVVVAAGTGTAGAASAFGSLPAEAAAGSGSAQGSSATIAVNAGLAAGTGAALNATARSDAFAYPQVATGTGSASDATTAIAVNAQVATGTGAANDAVVALQDSIYAQAEVASGTGSAAGVTTAISAPVQVASGTGDSGAAHASVSVNAAAASGTGAALDATAATQSATYAQAEAATGTGSASAVSAHVKPSAGIATGTGAAYNATASTLVAVYVDAERATGTGSASAISARVEPRAGLGSGSGTALNAVGRPSSYASAETASGTGSAYDATVRAGQYALAQAAAGTGQSNRPSAAIAPTAGAGAGSGAANNAGIVTDTEAAVFAGLATGTGQAEVAHVSIAPNAGEGEGSAHPGAEQGPAYSVISIDAYSSSISVETVSATIEAVREPVSATIGVDDQVSASISVEEVLASVA